MTPEAINAYFTPLDYFLYLGAIFVIMVVYYQWRWTRTCRMNVQVLVVKSDGSASFELAPKSGGSVALQDPKSGGVRIWPINKLSTIDVPYPGVGFVPTFLQKQIRMVVVDEDDWEPLINRNPNREMIASPLILGNLLTEKVTSMVTTINKELVDSLAGVTRKLSKLVSPTMFYIGIGVVLIGVCFIGWQMITVSGDISSNTEALNQIEKAIGISP